MDIQEEVASGYNINELADAIHKPPLTFLILTERNIQRVMKYRPIDELSQRLATGDDRTLQVSLLLHP